MGNLLPFNSICASTVCQREPNCDYEEGRRKVLKFAQHTLRKTDEVRIIEKYVEIPSGHVLFTKCYIPLNKKPKGCVFFLEGYGTNLDRPDTHNNCLIIAEDGYLVIAHDHIGYGRSDGLWLYIPNSFDTDYVDNAHFIHDFCKKLYIKELTSKSKHNQLYQYHDPSLFNNYDFDSNQDQNANVDNKENEDENKSNKLMPWTDLSYIDTSNKYFLCGRSMGGAIATRLAMKYPNDYKGLMLLCPMIEIDDALKPPFWITWIFMKIASWFPKRCWTPSNAMDQYMVSTEKGKCKVNTQTMKFDRNTRLKTAVECIKITEIIQENKQLLTMDFIVLHGLEDKVTDPKLSQNLYNDRKDQCDATIKLYDKSYHMMWWEPCADEMYSDLLFWLNEKSQ